MKTILLALCLLFAWGGNAFAASGPTFAVGAQGLILSKSVGGAWTSITPALIDAASFANATYNTTLQQSIFVGQDKKGNALVATVTADGATWRKSVGTGTRVVLPGGLSAVASQGDEYIAVGVKGSNLPVNAQTLILAGQSNGTLWSDVTANASGQGAFTAVTAGLDENGNNQYLVGGTTIPANVPSQRPLLFKGTGHGNWSQVTLPANIQGGVLSLTYNPDLKQYLAIILYADSNGTEQSNGLYLSRDGGQTWQVVRQVVGNQGGILSATYIPFAKQYIASGVGPQGPFISTSTDGVNWQDRPLTSLTLLRAISYSSALGKYMGVGIGITLTGGTPQQVAGILSSTDGVSWTQELPTLDPAGQYPDQLVGIATP